MTDTAEPRIEPLSFTQALGERYLTYALSTIMARSLPDVRDGLKPVHRRLLYAMRELRLEPSATPKKAARVVGDVIGKFHPHGDQAVYDALVRLAQDFAQRYPLIEGQGNFGSIDGDGAAAMRYTEARLTEVAEALLAGIGEDAVDFRPTYDGEGEEPVVLPAAFPNLLANGAQGIAVGMATAIPPHNAGELCDALLHLIRHPGAGAAQLVRLVRGPDFPTGGVLVDTPETMAEAYATGRGSFRLRARWQKEALSHGQFQIVVTEIPYQIPKARLIERIAALLNDRKLPLLEDVRDESTEDVRIVLTPRSRTVDAPVLMEQLFRLTDLEVRVPLNLNVLDATGTPRVMSLAEALAAFLAHRMEVLQRITRHRLGKIEHRLEVLAGQLIAFLNLDEVIRIIREEDEPKPVLMATFALTDVQAEAILNTRLRSLRRLEEMELKREHERLEAERSELEALLGDEAMRWQKIADEIADIRKRFGAKTALGRRRTEIGGPPPEIDVPADAAVEREPITVLLSRQGWLRAVRGHQDLSAEVKYKEGDSGRFALHAHSTDKLLLFASDGRFYTLAAEKLPRGRGFGEPLRLIIDLSNDAELIEMFVMAPDERLLVASSHGHGFMVRQSDVEAQTRSGRQVLNLAEGARAVACRPVAGDTVAVIGSHRKLLCFPLEEVPEMTRGRGVRLQRYRDAELVDLAVFPLADGLQWRMGERMRVERDLTPWMGRRGSVGRMPPRGFPKDNRFSAP
ncbi:MAG: DNA topoisomerase IV subunit A [Rhodospirillaceae bacterium]|nr:DNA topoisomerase IV subunit A [Rhodospirillaceae bacterium]